MAHKRAVFHAGDMVGKLLLQERLYDSETHTWEWHCKCECGNISTPSESNLSHGRSLSCGKCVKNIYQLCPDNKTMKVSISSGGYFLIDKEDAPLIKTQKWFLSTSQSGILSIITSSGTFVYHALVGHHKGLEVDHIDGNRLNNRRSNLRICTHQQNQCNRPLQRNNTSGVAGVRYYPRRRKFVARIKVSQYDLHLGYYMSLLEATQARNEGMRLMFGEYAVMNDVPDPPDWIKNQVYEKCSRHREKAAVPFGACMGDRT